MHILTSFWTQRIQKLIKSYDMTQMNFLTVKKKINFNKNTRRQSFMLVSLFQETFFFFKFWWLLMASITHNTFTCFFNDNQPHHISYISSLLLSLWAAALVTFNELVFNWSCYLLQLAVLWNAEIASPVDGRSIHKFLRPSNRVSCSRFLRA